MSDRYEMLQPELNCVIIALANTLEVEIGDLGKYIIDHKVGGVISLKELDNPATVKKVLEALGFDPVNKGGSTWLEAQAKLKTKTDKKNTKRVFGFYWRQSKKEKFVDDKKAVDTRSIVASDHAFSIKLPPNNVLEFLPTNEPNGFDKDNVKSLDDIVSLFIRDNKKPFKL